MTIYIIIFIIIIFFFMYYFYINYYNNHYNSNKWDIFAHKISNELGYSHINFTVNETNFTNIENDIINLDVTNKNIHITTKILGYQLAKLISKREKISFLSLNEKIQLYMAKNYNLAIF